MIPAVTLDQQKECKMVTKPYTITVTVNVRANDEKDLPEKKEVENLTCGLLLTPPATDTDIKWDVYSAHVRSDE
jgi:hypothetical protein